jgi:hypothetical protein
MAKGQLTFDLPEEQNEWEMANKASDVYSVLSELDNELRNHLKYGSHPEWDDATVEEIRKILNDLMMDRSIHFAI